MCVRSKHRTHAGPLDGMPWAKHCSQPGAGGATSGGVAPTVKGPGYGQTMPGHDATGGFRPVLNAGPDLSEVTQPGLGQGNTFVTSWDDMRKK